MIIFLFSSSQPKFNISVPTNQIVVHSPLFIITTKQWNQFKD